MATNLQGCAQRCKSFQSIQPLSYLLSSPPPSCPFPTHPYFSYPSFLTPPFPTLRPTSFLSPSPLSLHPPSFAYPSFPYPVLSLPPALPSPSFLSPSLLTLFFREIIYVMETVCSIFNSSEIPPETRTAVSASLLRILAQLGNV